jgi:hypothetical protein
MKVSDRITSPGGTRAYPVLPLRDIVVFPHDESVRALSKGRKRFSQTT